MGKTVEVYNTYDEALAICLSCERNETKQVQKPGSEWNHYDRCVVPRRSDISDSTSLWPEIVERGGKFYTACGHYRKDNFYKSNVPPYIVESVDI